MEFVANLPTLDGVGGILRLNCPGYGPNKYVPGLEADCQWNTDRPVTGTPEEQAAEIARRRDVIAAAVAEIVDEAGNLAFVYDGSTREEDGETVYNAPDHLRIYGLPHMPGEEVAKYLANRPPVGFHWGTLSLSYNIVCDHNHKGFKDSKVYSDRNGVPQYGLQFTHSGVTIEGRSALLITEQAYWLRNDGSQVFAPFNEVIPPKLLWTDSQAWIDYLEACRKTINRNYKLWIPKILVALGETIETVGDAALLESRAKSSAWISGPIDEGMRFYVDNGDPRPLAAALAADVTTLWLNEVVPDGIVSGLALGKTVREMILEGLR